MEGSRTLDGFAASSDVEASLPFGQSTRGIQRLVKYTVDGEVRRMRSSATTFTELRRDLKRIDTALPTDFIMYNRVEDGSAEEWESEMCYNDQIPQSTQPSLSDMQPQQPSVLHIQIKPTTAARGTGTSGTSGQDYRGRFIGLLKNGGINKPKDAVLDVVEGRCATRMMVCSGVTMAVNLYNDVQLFPGASTQSHLFTQHGLRVNGPLFTNPADGPACLLYATDARGIPTVVKMLAGSLRPGAPTQQQDLGGSEAAAFRCLYPANEPVSEPLVAAKLVTLELTEKHISTGRAPGLHAALVMPCYPSTVFKLLKVPAAVLFEQGKRMRQALEYIHSKFYVHMDVKGDNMFVDQSGQWRLGDFGSAVPEGQPILSTTQLLAPSNHLIGTPAKFHYDWHMLAATLVCELHKPNWAAALVEDGHTPYGKLRSAVEQVQEPELRSFLDELLLLASP